MRFRFVSAAENEFMDAAVFYEEEESGLGDEFISTVLNSVDRLLEMPLLGTRVGARVRSIPLSRFPFNIVYNVDDDEIVVVTVANQSRRPEYWHDRF